MFNELVIGIDDYDAGNDAIELAKELRSSTGHLSLVYVDVVEAPDSDVVFDAEKRAFAQERLGILRDEAEIAAAIVCVRARSVERGLHELAADASADLLVIGASRSHIEPSLFVGDHTREVLRDAPCTVAVAPAGYRKRSAAIQKIGVAYDGSPESERALALAGKLAEERRAGVSTSEDRAERADDAVDALRQFGASVDLLVLGSHRSHPANGFLHRSTAQLLAEDAPAPLLVLPSTSPR